MGHNQAQTWRWPLLAAAASLVFAANAANAEPRTVRIAKQNGISYLPLTVMAEKKLIESEGKKLGLDLSTEWVRFNGEAPMNEALISGDLDFAAGGVVSMVTIWARTKGNFRIKGVSALNSMPLWLNSSNPHVKTIHDFTAKDRIALPAVRVSMPAVILQMAAEKEFGGGQDHKLDAWTVPLSDPDGLAQMISGKPGITGHFTSAPFMYAELEDKRVHRVLSSFDVFGGPHTLNVVWAAAKFYEDEPKIVQAFLAALRAAMKEINDNPAAAAALWVTADESKLTPAQAGKIIKDKDIIWTMTPQKAMDVAGYMGRMGLIPATPASWKDMFISNIHNLPGN